MEKQNLKEIVKNLKSLVDVLESEVYSDIDAYRNSVAFKGAEYSPEYDDDDGVPD